MEILKKICLVLIIIGAINWAFVGLFSIDLVASLFGGTDNIDDTNVQFFHKNLCQFSWEYFTGKIANSDTG